VRTTAKLSLAALGLASLMVPSALANPEPARVTPTDLFERARVAKRSARAPLLPQTRHTVRQQIESIEPVSWLERYGKVRIREHQRDR